MHTIFTVLAALIVTVCDCRLEIQRPNAKFSKIFLNGKEWEPDQLHFGLRYSVEFRYKNSTYFAVVSGPSQMGEQSEEVDIISCESKKLVGHFSMISADWNIWTNKLVSSADGTSPWDGRTWTPNFDRCVLIEDWSKIEIPMNLDDPNGFFPDQKLLNNIVVNSKEKKRILRKTHAK